MGILKRIGDNSGQALIETVLVMPLMLLIILNVINFGYFFLVAVNLAATPRAGVEYSILGFATPGSLSLPNAGPPNTQTTISYIGQQDLTGALNAPTSATIEVCSPTVGVNVGPPQTTQCTSCSGSTCTSNSNTPPTDPESPNFVLNRVDVTYTFSPIIPGTPFGLALLPLDVCSSSGGNVTCTFHREVLMRVMN